MNKRFLIFFFASSAIHVLIIVTLFSLFGKAEPSLKKQTVLNIKFQLIQPKQKIKRYMKKSGFKKLLQSKRINKRNNSKIRKIVKKLPTKKFKKIKKHKKTRHPNKKRHSEKTKKEIRTSPKKLSDAGKLNSTHVKTNTKNKKLRRDNKQKNHYSQVSAIKQAQINEYIEKIIKAIKDIKFYPQKARMLGIEGNIHVKFFITKNKKLKFIQIKPEIRFLSKAAIKIIKEAVKESPAPPENLTLSVTVSFRLE